MHSPGGFFLCAKPEDHPGLNSRGRAQIRSMEIMVENVIKSYSAPPFIDNFLLFAIREIVACLSRSFLHRKKHLKNSKMKAI